MRRRLHPTASVLAVVVFVALDTWSAVRTAEGLPRCYSEKAHFLQHLPGELKLTGESSPPCDNPGKYAGGSCKAHEVGASHCIWHDGSDIL